MTSLLGLFRRLGKGAGVTASVSMVEELFGPTRHHARVVIEAQRQAAQPVEAPGDPSDEGSGTL